MAPLVCRRAGPFFAMATASKKTKVETVVTGVTLELSKEEAEFLTALLWRGVVFASAPLAHGIYSALSAAGVSEAPDVRFEAYAGYDRPMLKQVKR